MSSITVDDIQRLLDENLENEFTLTGSGSSRGATVEDAVKDKLVASYGEKIGSQHKFWEHFLREQFGPTSDRNKTKIEELLDQNVLSLITGIRNSNCCVR